MIYFPVDCNLSDIQSLISADELKIQATFHVQREGYMSDHTQLFILSPSLHSVNLSWQSMTGHTDIKKKNLGSQDWLFF